MSVQSIPADVVTALAAALLHALWQCAVLAAVADVMLRLSQRRSAALRHTVGMGLLVTMAFAPAWTFLRGLSRLSDGTLHRSPGVPVLSSVASDILARTMSGWAAPLCAVWIAGVVAMLVQYAGGLWWLDRLDRRTMRAVPTEWLERLHALQHSMGISRAIVVRLADDVLVPFTARVFRPIIWIPSTLLTRLPTAQLEALLAHELAHIRRLDWLWNGLQCVIEALLFFHPGMWWLSRRVREERELACDAIAATACADPVPLAEALAALARDRQTRPRLVLAADAHPLLERITLLLSGVPGSPRRAPRPGLFVLLLAGTVLAVPLHPPRVISVQRPELPAAPVGGAPRFGEPGGNGRGDLTTLAMQHESQQSRRAQADAKRAQAQARDARDAAAGERIARIAEQAMKEAARFARAANAPTAAPDANAPSAVPNVDAPTAAPDATAPTASPAAKPRTAVRAVKVVKSVVSNVAIPAAVPVARTRRLEGSREPT